MKRRGYLIEAIAEPANLRLAFVHARRGKSASQDVLRFAERLNLELQDIREEIRSGELRPITYRKFTIYEPKRREICAGSFRANVLHHAIMNICHDDFERRQIFDSYACRKGKGTHAAVQRAQAYTRKYQWYLKLDVRDFFASVHHGVVTTQLTELFKDEKLLGIFRQIISSYTNYTQRGLPLGNLTSQYFANHYLSPVDWWVKQGVRAPAYVRYMDDMVLWSNDKYQLLNWQQQLEEIVQVQLEGALKEPILARSSQGLSFLGYRIFPYQLRLTQRSRRRLITKLRRIDRALQLASISEATAQRRAESLIAFAAQAQTLGLRQNLLKNNYLKPGYFP